VLTDYHLHLQPDGPEARDAAAAEWDAHGGPRSAGWVGRYVEAARSRAVGEIAITEHVHRFRDVRDWHPNPWWQAEATEDLAAHCAALAAVRDDHGLPILIGLEMDWIPGREDDTRALLGAHPFDIVLGSVHWLGDLAVDHPDYPCWDALGPDETWGRYLDELARAVGSGLFDVLAHPDLPKVFGTRMPRALTRRRDEVIAGIAAAGVAVECSSAGLRKPVGEVYPDPDWLAVLHRAGVPVTLASDAHRPTDVAAGYATTVAALRGAGYETITRFRRREPEQVRIRWA
jgi:histidinol-phosphatase (PHP family)